MASVGVACNLRTVRGAAQVPCLQLPDVRQHKLRLTFDASQASLAALIACSRWSCELRCCCFAVALGSYLVDNAGLLWKCHHDCCGTLCNSFNLFFT